MLPTEAQVHTEGRTGGTARVSNSGTQNTWMLFLASFLVLYFELVVIRYLSTEIRVFAYLKNLTLIASFFGIGLGMTLGQIPKLRRYFPLVTAAMFLLITFAAQLRLTHLPIPGAQYAMFGSTPEIPAGPFGVFWIPAMFMFFFAVVSGMLNLVVMFFMVLGGLVGERLAPFEPLRGYAINLAGSLAGILAFTALSFAGLPPVIWVLIGLLVAVPFFIRERLSLSVFALLVCAMALPHPDDSLSRYSPIVGRALEQQTFWSPYYRITLLELAPPAGWSRPGAYILDVNHDYHQKVIDLSSDFTSRFPNYEPNHASLPAYNLAYELVPNPGQVLVVGAGTGNDVASAVRHGATHVDAVEIDPTILKLGRKYHPEHPYDSPRVTVHNDDARAFLKRTNQKYDLIVFGFLDSHTMLTSFSALRLDDYVYTLESFREAKALLKDGGTMVLGFAAGRSYITDRIFATLTAAFGQAPVAYFTKYDVSGVVFVEGKGASHKLPEYEDITPELKINQSGAILATDHWPFLYLQSRTIPTSMLGVMIIFVFVALGVMRRTNSLGRLTGRQDLHLFFLGAGFMLLETRGVTELSLLFGSTWIVNAIVIASFLTMGLLANALVIFRPISRSVAYGALFLLLILGIFVPYSVFSPLPVAERVLAAAVLVGLPVFFSGLVFSLSFREVTNSAQGLGVNLLGAVIGGVLENLVMIGGTPILGMLAILLYGFSAVLLTGLFARRERSISEAAQIVSA